MSIDSDNVLQFGMVAGGGSNEEGCFAVSIVHITARHEKTNNALYDMENQLFKDCTKHNIKVTLSCVEANQWARELMPWPDSAVSCDEEVGRHAADTLAWLDSQKDRWSGSSNDRVPFGRLCSDHVCPVILGGYSLGGLFSLWATRRCSLFQGVVAGSPSLWIRDWDTYAKAHPIHVQSAYLSLGLSEEHCRNQRMAKVGDCVRREHELLTEELGENRTVLEWNEGGHFVNEGIRMANGYLWTILNLRQQQAK